MNTENRYFALALVAVLSLVVLILSVRITPAHDADHGGEDNPAIQQWYKNLKQPDNPAMSCCGVADAYWCDDYYARNGKAFCKITDDRPDGPRGRPHREVGEEFEIPPHKLKWDHGNPTGHGVVFLSRDGQVYCYVQPGGV